MKVFGTQLVRTSGPNYFSGPIVSDYLLTLLQITAAE